MSRNLTVLGKNNRQGIKEGWYDGGSIAFAVILVVVVTGKLKPVSANVRILRTTVVAIF